MGNKGSNHEGGRAASARSIEIDFIYQGDRCRERLCFKRLRRGFNSRRLHHLTIQIKHLRVLFLCLWAEKGLFRHSMVSFLVSFF